MRKPLSNLSRHLQIDPPLSLAPNLGPAVRWLLDQPIGVRVVDIQARFGLTALLACEAIKAAQDLRGKETIR